MKVDEMLYSQQSARSIHSDFWGLNWITRRAHQVDFSDQICWENGKKAHLQKYKNKHPTLISVVYLQLRYWRLLQCWFQKSLDVWVLCTTSTKQNVIINPFSNQLSLKQQWVTMFNFHSTSFMDFFLNNKLGPRQQKADNVVGRFKNTRLEDFHRWTGSLVTGDGITIGIFKRFYIYHSVFNFFGS